MKLLRWILPAVLILVVTFLALAPSLKNGFVNQWDDNEYLLQNPHVRELSWKSLARIFTPSVAAMAEGHLYVPLVKLSYAVEYHFFGLDPFTYHLTNLALHLLNCLLVFWLFFLISRNLFVAAWTALLFGIHPLRVESVAWITERKDVLYAFFYFGALIGWTYFLRGRKFIYYALSLGLFGAALLSKPLALSLPFVLLLLDGFLDGSIPKKRIVEKIPFFVMIVLYLWLSGGLSGGYQRADPFHYRVFFPAYAVLFYLGKLFFPFNLSCLYPFPSTPSGGLPLSFLISPCMVLLLASAVFVSLKRTRKIVFGSVFFLFAVFPALQFFPTGAAFIADRYVYVASAGVFYLMAEGIVWLFRGIPVARRPAAAVSIAVVLLLIGGALSVLTFRRCAVWKDGLALWNDTVKKYPSAMAYNQRGLWLAGIGEYARARSDYETAIAMDPTFEYAYLNLGLMYKKMGKSDEAAAEFGKILAVEPENLHANLNVGHVYVLQRRLADAAAAYEKVLKVDPNHVLCLNANGLVYEVMGRKDDATRMFRRVLAIDPEDVPAREALARLQS